MNKAVFIIGIVATLFTIVNVFASVIILVLFCFDSCPPVATTVANSPQTLLLFVGVLSTSIALTAVAWIWELVALRRLRATGTLVFAAILPVIAIAAVFGVAALAAVSSGLAPLQFTALQLWDGYFALALWPLAVSVIAFIYRERAPRQPRAPAMMPPGPPNAAQG